MPKSSVSSKHHSLRRFAASRITVLAGTVLFVLIDAYRVVLRPVIGPACRFAPTCSLYAEQAIRRHGPLMGAWLTVRRVGRCHPWNPGGHDPVPQRSR